MTDIMPDFSKAKVLVVGDVMLDRYWYGDTSRISPEAPVPVVHVKNIEQRPGGASNVALNIKALGGEVTLLGITGEDQAAYDLEQLLVAAGVNCSLQKFNNIPTILKLRVIGRQQQLIRLDFEEALLALEGKNLFEAYRRELAKVEVVIISDYAKGIAQFIPELIKIAKAQHKKVLLDPKQQDFSCYKGVDLITPNLAEFEAVVGKCTDEQQLAAKGKELLAKYDFAGLLVTRGSCGMSLLTQHSPPMHIPTQAREVYDVTGAGDTVIAVLGSALAAGGSLPEAIRLANTAAGIVVGKLGAATVSIAALRRELKIQQKSWLGIVSKARLVQEVADAKAHGESIVFTNGCFDILHAGHIAYLEQAKALGDRLIVAVNDDASVTRIKGQNRPINSLAQRMAVLTGLRVIDWVVAFSEDTPETLIKAISPDVLVKGGDYRADEIVGAKYVRQCGGRVEILSYIDNHSTSIIIDKIKGDGA